MSFEYTEDIPVLTNALLEHFRKIAPDSRWLPNIRLAETPDVFKAPTPAANYFDYDAGVRIWKRELPSDIQLFVACALQVFGREASHKLPSVLTLDREEKLADKEGKPLTLKCIAEPYINGGIDQRLARAFGEYFVATAESILQNLPPDLCLGSSTIDKNLDYAVRCVGSLNAHTDEDYTNVIIHFSEPGTPFFPGGTGKPDLFYRAKPGYVSAHGSRALHGFATTRPHPDGTAPNRFFAGYNIHSIKNISSIGNLVR